MTGASGSVTARGDERIAVRCPNWLGDVVMTTPALHAVRVHRPEAHLTAFLPEPLVPLLTGAEFLDEVRPLKSRAGAPGPSAWWADRASIARAGFDRALVFPESISSAWLMRAAGVPRVAGFARDPLRRFLLHEVVPSPPSWGRRRLVSRERFAMELVRAVFGLAASQTTDLRLRLAVTREEEARLAAALHVAEPSRPRVNRPPIVIAPGASFGETKCWPVESYASLADRIAVRGERVVLIGAPGEEARVAAVKSAMREPATVLAGRLDLGALKALLRGARALVANDAGARHVAAAFGVPSVIFFGPTSVEKTADNLERIEVLETEHDCRPCYSRTCALDHRCLRSISVDSAFDAAARAIARAEA